MSGCQKHLLLTPDTRHLTPFSLHCQSNTRAHRRADVHALDERALHRRRLQAGDLVQKRLDVFDQLRRVEAELADRRPARRRPCRCGTPPCPPCIRAPSCRRPASPCRQRGEGIRPRGPSTLPSGPTSFIMSGAAMQASNSVQPPLIFSANSSSPTTSAPASRASSAFGPLANTTTRCCLPMPCGSTIDPRIDLLGLRLVDAQPNGDLDRLVELRAVKFLERLHRLGQRQTRLRRCACSPVPDIVWIVLPSLHLHRSKSSNVAAELAPRGASSAAKSVSTALD